MRSRCSIKHRLGLLYCPVLARKLLICSFIHETCAKCSSTFSISPSYWLNYYYSASNQQWLEMVSGGFEQFCFVLLSYFKKVTKEKRREEKDKNESQSSCLSY